MTLRLGPRGNWPPRQDWLEILKKARTGPVRCTERHGGTVARQIYLGQATYSQSEVRYFCGDLVELVLRVIGFLLLTGYLDS